MILDASDLTVRRTRAKGLFASSHANWPRATRWVTGQGRKDPGGGVGEDTRAGAGEAPRRRYSFLAGGTATFRSAGRAGVALASSGSIATNKAESFAQYGPAAVTYSRTRSS
jgi:hypothetical protein